jgi:hypothetical protein
MCFSEYDECFEWKCEACGLTVEFPRNGAGSFMAAVHELKARGWLIARGRELGEWHHYCAQCRRGMAARILGMKFKSGLRQA